MPAMPPSAQDHGPVTEEILRTAQRRFALKMAHGEGLDRSNRERSVLWTDCLEAALPDELPLLRHAMGEVVLAESGLPFSSEGVAQAIGLLDPALAIDEIEECLVDHYAYDQTWAETEIKSIRLRVRVRPASLSVLRTHAVRPSIP